MSQRHYDIVRASGAMLDQPLIPSPYPHKIKCYVHKVGGYWKVTGHRWGDVPYHVGYLNAWGEAVDLAERHVRDGGLSWTVSPSRGQS